MRLVYVSAARLPTQKAHGYQICKMCEAFARLGIDVILMHPWRHQHESAMRGRSVFEYYALDKSFAVRTLPNWDIVRLQRRVPWLPFAAVTSVHGLTWGALAVRAAQREQGDLYYTRDPRLAYWLTRFRMPTVSEIHVVPARVQRWALRRVVKNPSLRLFVTLTSFTKARLQDLGARADRVIALPDAVDLKHFEGLPDRETCRRRLDLPLDRPIVGYIGRFQAKGEEKGLPELVRAAAHLAPLGGAAPLLLCVGGPMDAVPAYRALARDLRLGDDRVQFVDRVPNVDVPLWIRAADVVTIPRPWTDISAYATSPLKLFEYMAAEAPIVATDLPSLREVLRHGENAWLVAPGDPRALAEGFTRLLTDGALRRRLAAQGRQDVGRYTWMNRAQAVLDHVAR